MGNRHLRFCLYGPSGSGKSTLLELLQNLYENVTVHQKYTTRKPREGEDPAGTKDLLFVEKIPQGACEVIYMKHDNYYGIRKEILVQAFADKDIHFILTQDIFAMKQMKVLYPDTKCIYLHSDTEVLENRLGERADHDVRIKKIQKQFKGT